MTDDPAPQLMDDRCPTCVFRPGNPMRLAAAPTSTADQTFPTVPYLEVTAMTRPMPRSAAEVAELFPELAVNTRVIVYTDWSRGDAVRFVQTTGTVARHARGGYVTVREAQHGTTCDYDPRDVIPAADRPRRADLEDQLAALAAAERLAATLRAALQADDALEAQQQPAMLACGCLPDLPEGHQEGCEERVPTCPYGCGPLQAADDAWICPKCGDEWSEDHFTAASTDTEAVQA